MHVHVSLLTRMKNSNALHIGGWTDIGRFASPYAEPKNSCTMAVKNEHGESPVHVTDWKSIDAHSLKPLQMLCVVWVLAMTMKLKGHPPCSLNTSVPLLSSTSLRKFDYAVIQPIHASTSHCNSRLSAHILLPHLFIHVQSTKHLKEYWNCSLQKISHAVMMWAVARQTQVSNWVLTSCQPHRTISGWR